MTRWSSVAAATWRCRPDLGRRDRRQRGQATAPFDFLMRLSIGDRPAIAYQIELPLPAMEAATEALDVACQGRAG